MRLICPNCDAQYAIADDLIPSAGRDVQCSNCAHTWFQRPDGADDDTAPAAAAPFSGSIEAAFEGPDPDDDIEETLAPAPQPPADRKPMDPSVADILREEAARETAQRQTEVHDPIEEQPDLDIPEPAPTREAQYDAAPAAAAAVAATAMATADAPRKEMFPDIEEINSSLRSSSDREAPPATPQEMAEAKKRGGFRTGFFGVLLIVGILAVIYVYAPQIKAAVPAVAETVDSYVAAVDHARIWLDTTVRNLITPEE